MDALPGLIALDLDGTLLTSDKRVSARARRAVRAVVARGAQVVLCTGRPPRLTLPYLEELELAEAIVFNGASLLDGRSGESVHHHVLPCGVAREAIARLRAAFPGALVGLEAAHGWYLDPPLFEARRAALQGAGLPPPTGVGEVEGFLRDGAIKVFARHPDRAAPELAAALVGLDVYRTWSGPHLLEVMHPAVNKRAALARLARARGVPRARVAAFGDQDNDREMLEWAGLGVAMGNASPEALAAADERTLPNDEDGVAARLERWLEAADA